MALTAALPNVTLTSDGRPNPNAVLTQLVYAVDFGARYLGFLGPAGIAQLIADIASGNWVGAITVLAGSNDPDVKRLSAVLKESQQKYPNSGHSFGYFAVIVIANTSAGGGKVNNGGPWVCDPLPWGTPDN